MYPNLKIQIFKLGLQQTRLARLVGMDESILSRIIHGHREPSETQRKLLARYLQVDENWLFEKYEGVSQTRGTDRVTNSPEGKNVHS